MKSVINSLWVGERLTPIGVLSINSFLGFNHEYNLWTYNYISNIPKGTIQRNAEEIVGRDVYDRWFGENVVHPQDVFRKKVHQNFSDYFRYKLLNKLGGWWCDTDIVALKPFDFEQEYVFSWGRWPCKWMEDDLKARLGIDRALNNGTMKCPAGCELIQRMLACESKAIKAEFPTWAEWNKPLSGHVCDLGLQKYVPQNPIFEPYGEDDWRIPFEQNVQPPAWAYSLHLYNSQGVKDSQPGSLVDRLKGKHVSMSFL
jgi:hypothetical protein